MEGQRSIWAISSAVVANSLPGVTPAQHSDLAREIVARGGAIVSELHSASKQTGDFYIPRNRIIAALTEGTVVVEAAGGSGALSTADMALGYNRVLMAVPGRATDSAAWGTNLLIKSEKAVMVCSGDDVVRALGWDLRNVAGADLDGTDFGTAGHAAASGGVALLRPGWLRSAAAKAANSRETGGLSAATGGLSDAATGLLKCFVGGDATSVDSLIEITALVYSELAPLLLELEFAGRIRRLPGGSYEKIS